MASCSSCGQPVPDVEFGITIDPRRNIISVDGAEHHLPPRLIQIASALVDAKGKPLSKDDIEDIIYAESFGRRKLQYSPVVAVFMSKLRNHLKPLGLDIRSYYRSGYALERIARDKSATA